MSELCQQVESVEYKIIDVQGVEQDVIIEFLDVLKSYVLYLLLSFVVMLVFYGGVGGVEKMCKQMKVLFLGWVFVDFNFGKVVDEG